jgi:hypothetical protein
LLQSKLRLVILRQNAPSLVLILFHREIISFD